MKTSFLHAPARVWFFACALLLTSIASAGPDQNLVEAALNGELKKVERALKRGAKVDARGEKNATALMLAGEGGFIDIVQALIKAGADVNATRDSGFAPLHGASATGNINVVQALVAAGANVSAPSATGTTPLHAAALSGNVELMKLLVEKGADPKAVDTRGLNLLDFALNGRKGPAVLFALDAGLSLTESGRKRALFALLATPSDRLLDSPAIDPAVIRAVIANGAELEVTDQDGMTPLLRASKLADVGAVEALIDAKANMAAVDKDGATALSLNASRDTVENLRLMFGLGQTGNAAAGVRQFFRPAERSDVSPSTARRLAIARKLIAGGANANLADKEGYTPLHRAVQIGDVELVELLIVAGANINAVSDQNSTPLIIAAKWAYEAPCAALLKAGADTSIVNKNGETALSVARSSTNPKVAVLLEAAGAK